jgi:mono/diheme cytochrome c family protein
MNNTRINLLKLLGATLSIVLVSMFSGCGGSGGATTSGTPPITSNTINGIAATGAPIVGVVSIKDSSLPSKELTAFTASDGSFAFSTSGLQAPFMLKTSSGGKNLYSYSETSTGVINITPLTSIAASVAVGGANLDLLYSNATATSIAAAAANIADSVTIVHSVLFPLLNQYGVTGNILNAPFYANHTGVDSLLDMINVTIAANVITITNKSNLSIIFSGSSSYFVTLVGTKLPSLTGTFNAVNIPAPPVMIGYALYTANCSGCHGNVANSALFGISTPATISAAIARDLGGMSFLSKLTLGEIQAIDLAINNPRAAPATSVVPLPGSGVPSVPSTGATLYNANCATCHGPLATSAKLGASFVRIQNAISGNVGGMGSLPNLTALTGPDLQAIEAALNPTPTGAPASGVPATPPTVIDGAALYTANCSGCHGPLATSTKQGITIARFQTAVTNNTGGMGYLSTLSVNQVQAIVTALTPSTTTPTPTPNPNPNPTPGSTLYATACGNCHGPLATSAKAGATVARITTAIGPGAGSIPSMAYLSILTPADITAIAASLATVTPPTTPVVPVCGSCHALPPATGMHLFHLTNKNAVALKITCATCHGAGYSTSVTTDKLPATHNNGVKNMATGIPPGWTPNAAPATGGTCSNACHGRKTW